MATAKERGHKDWGFGGVVKRNFKSDKSDGEYNQNRDYAKRWYTNTKRIGTKKFRKDTKRWCKGREGREHVWAKFPKFKTWWDFKCVNCCKESYYIPKHGFFRTISYRSNNEYDLTPMSEMKF